jgi:FMN-dependent NADH-azoreductase
MPLVLGKKMVVASSRGSDYSAGGPMHAYDFQEPYLRAIFGFIGITDVEFVYAEGLAIGTESRNKSLLAAQAQSQRLATQYAERPLTRQTRLAA